MAIKGRGAEDERRRDGRWATALTVGNTFVGRLTGLSVSASSASLASRPLPAWELIRPSGSALLSCSSQLYVVQARIRVQLCLPSPVFRVRDSMTPFSSHIRRLSYRASKLRCRYGAYCLHLDQSCRLHDCGLVRAVSAAELTSNSIAIEASAGCNCYHDGWTASSSQGLFRVRRVAFIVFSHSTRAD